MNSEVAAAFGTLYQNLLDQRFSSEPLTEVAAHEVQAAVQQLIQVAGSDFDFLSHLVNELEASQKGSGFDQMLKLLRGERVVSGPVYEGLALLAIVEALSEAPNYQAKASRAIEEWLAYSKRVYSWEPAAARSRAEVIVAHLPRVKSLFDGS